MTERHGPGFGDEGGQRPSGRGAVTERLANRDDANEIDLTDRESSGAFEPAPPAAPTADPPAEAERPGSTSIFEIDERAKQEDQHPTGYEPPLADTDTPRDEPRDEPRGEPAGTEAEAEGGQPAETEAEAGQPADAGASDITPTPVPVAEPPSEEPTEAPAASLAGTLDAPAIRGRFLDIQAGFVDEPRQAVEEAGRFVDELVQQVTEALRSQRAQLAGVTDEGDTEDLRLALRAHRQFVDRLLGLAG
jgi:hypothetical protein